MEDSERHEVDRDQVKKAADYLLHHCKTRRGRHDPVLLSLDFWRFPSEAQVIHIPLPHKFRPDPTYLSFFTKMEPEMSVKRTKAFYKELLSRRGFSQEIRIVPLGNPRPQNNGHFWQKPCHLAFADAKIRSLVEARNGKPFCDRYAEFVDLESGDLAAKLNLRIQSTRLNLYTGSTCAISVGHLGMALEHIVDNALAAAEVLAETLSMKWKDVKSLSLMIDFNMPLPVYSAPSDRLRTPEEEIDKEGKKPRKRKLKSPEIVTAASGDQPADKKKDPAAPHKKQKKAENGGTGIPQPSSAKKRKIDKEGKKPRKRKLKSPEIVTSASGDQPADKKKDPTAPHKKQKKAENGETGNPQPSSAKKRKSEEGEEKKKRRKKSAKANKVATAGETGDQPADKKKDHKEQKKADNGETGIPQPLPSSAKKRKIEEGEEKKKRKKSAKASKVATSGSGDQPADKKKDPAAPHKKQKKAENGATGIPQPSSAETSERKIEEKKKRKRRKKSAKVSKVVTAGETGDLAADKKKDHKEQDSGGAGIPQPLPSSAETSERKMEEGEGKKKRKRRKKSAKASKVAISEETGDQPADKKKDPAAPHKEQDNGETGIPQPLPSSAQTSERKEGKNKKRRRKKLKAATIVTTGSGDQLADKKKDTAAPHKAQDNGETGIPQLLPMSNSAKTSDRKETDDQEKSKGSEEKVQGASTTRRSIRRSIKVEK